MPTGSRHHRRPRSEEHTSELQSRGHLVCRLLLEKKNDTNVAEHNLKQSDLETEIVVPFAAPSEYQVVRFFFNDTATTEIYTLSLHDALPICRWSSGRRGEAACTARCTTPSR